MLVIFLAKNLRFAPFYLSSLVANSYFLNSNYPLLAPKNPLLTTILPFLAMSFMDLKGFVYTIAVNVYAFRLAFSGKSHYI